MRSFINITFDNKEAPEFFVTTYDGARRIIGTRYGAFFLQFRSIAQAVRAVRAYRAYLEKNGYSKDAVVQDPDGVTDYSTCVFADIGNHSHWHVYKLDELKRDFFYLNKQQ